MKSTVSAHFETIEIMFCLIVSSYNKVNPVRYQCIIVDFGKVDTYTFSQVAKGLAFFPTWILVLV